MSRKTVDRWELTGVLVAESAIHVGGIGDAPPHLVQARDGLGRPILPGTSLAGVIQAALGSLDPAEARLWNPTPGRDGNGRDDGTGEASWVSVNDAAAPETTPTEVHEHVSIDRVHGVAATGHLFTREALPAGTRFTFRMVVDDADGSTGGRLIHRVAALLRGPGITIGASGTKGMGHIRLHDANLRRHDLATRAGIIAILSGTSPDMDLPQARPDDLADGVLRIVIPWRPRGPLAVHVSADGDVVDAFPLATVRDGAFRLELPGSTIKGVLRGHAERIARTVTNTDAPTEFLDQMRATGLGPVGALFGTAADRDSDGQPTGRRGALRVNTCISASPLPAQQWRDVRLLQRRLDDHSTSGADANRAALARLQRAVDDLNARTKGIRFVPGQPRPLLVAQPSNVGP